MGIYDRDYSREEGGFFLGGDRMMVTNLILITAAVYLLQLLFDTPRGDQPLTDFLSLDANLFSWETVTHPWRILSLVTYGFAHSRADILHILFNMFFLWFLGREMEERYGRIRFLAMYLTTILFAGLVWVLSVRLADPLVEGYIPNLVGASGGVAGVLLLFVLNYPRRIFYIWAILPVPAWALALFWLFVNVFGAVSQHDNVAYVAHLAGGAYGWIFYKTGWTLAFWTPTRGSFKMPRFRKPKLRIHDPDEMEDALGEEVDQILRKIAEHGQDSLTAKERRTLERASRRYQQKHR